MKTQELIFYPAKRYGITEKKKAELDALTIQVLDAQYDVAQQQAIVTSLAEKSQNFLAFLAVADANKTQALNNRNLLDQVVQNALNLQDNSDIAFNEIVIADAQTKTVAVEIKSLIDKLIYSAEVINKLATLVIRTKAVNPLISDDLVARIGTAGTDANNAVALALIALKSTFTAQASSLEAEAASVLEYIQAMKLYAILTGAPVPEDEVGDEPKVCLHDLLYQAYAQAEAAYKDAYRASKDTTKQLGVATANLNQAQIKLRSVQLGLAAANAAALAS